MPVTLLAASVIAIVGAVALEGYRVNFGTSSSLETGDRSLLDHSAVRLAEARAVLAQRSGDGGAALRVAMLEHGRALLLAVVAYQEYQKVQGAPPDTFGPEYPRWQECFLRTDPGGCLTRATVAARTALKAALPPRVQRDALFVLSAARMALGDFAGGAAALKEAVRREPENHCLWLKLAQAYNVGRHWAQAIKTADRSRALASKLWFPAGADLPLDHRAMPRLEPPILPTVR
jgi:hypothetical protein